MQYLFWCRLNIPGLNKKDMNMISLPLPVYIALCQFWKIKIGSIKVRLSLPEVSLQNLEKQQMFILHKPLIQKT